MSSVTSSRGPDPLAPDRRSDPGRRTGARATREEPPSLLRMRELELENHELLEIIAAAAHDLKEPLRNLRNTLESLGRQGPLPEATLLESLLEGARRNERLVDDLLVYARTIGVPISREPISLEEPLRWALANLHERIEEEAAEIRFDPLPHVHADRGRLIRLFQNLVANALTYRGDAPARVHVSARAAEREWRVSVRDRGIGIEPDHREHVFAPFARLHPVYRYPGTGLGLAICRRIVHAHGGRIWIEPTRGTGTEFVFTLPRSTGPGG